MMGDLKNYTVARRCHVAFNLSQRVTGFQDIQFHTNSSGGAQPQPHVPTLHPSACKGLGVENSMDDRD